MTTGSWCLTEILMSVKPCSSNSEHSHSADSTSASGVALPYLESSRLSSEPALTPMRIGTPASFAALAISATLSSKALMLPGLTRTAAQPASIAANTYFGWKWMSAITGICDLRAISGSASASSWDGTATRTIWQPAAVSSAICCRVALTSAVRVVVMDCTDTGAPPPTGTFPTMICRDFRLPASGSGGSCGMPRSIVMCSLALDLKVDRVEDIGRDQQRAEADKHSEDEQAHRDQPLDVDQTRVRAAAQPVEPCPDPLEDHHGQVTAVERQQGQQVEHPDEDVERGDDLEHDAQLGLPRQGCLNHLAGHLTNPDDAADLAGRGAASILGKQVRYGGGQPADGRGRGRDRVRELVSGIRPGTEERAALVQHGGLHAEVGHRPPRNLGKRDLHLVNMAGAPDHDRDAGIGRQPGQRGVQLIPASDRAHVYRDDLVTRLQASDSRRRLASRAARARVGISERLGAARHARRDGADHVRV